MRKGGIFLQIKNSLKYSLYVIFHPFNGFWELKREKKGSPWSVFIILTTLIILLCLKQQFTGFILNPNVGNSPFSLILQIEIVLIPFLLWCVSNWSITTLVDGEGTFKDIAITTAYSLIPIILFTIPLIIMSRFITFEESQMYDLLFAISLIWSAFLLLTGIMTIHQFSLTKTLITILIAIVGMLVISFIILLFFALISQVYNWAYLIYREISLRNI